MASLRQKFEDDPKFQAKFHIVATYFWLVNMIVVPFVFVFAKGFWNNYSVFYILVASLYANFATDYDGVSSSEASGHAKGAEDHLDEEDETK